MSTWLFPCSVKNNPLTVENGCLLVGTGQIPIFGYSGKTDEIKGSLLGVLSLAQVGHVFTVS